MVFKYPPVSAFKPFASHSYAQIRASEPGINFKLEFTISQVDAHSTVPIIVRKKREREIVSKGRGRREEGRMGTESGRSSRVSIRTRVRDAYCCGIMHHYSGLFVARGSPSSPKGDYGESGTRIKSQISGLPWTTLD